VGVTSFHRSRIVREPDAPGWLIIYRSYGWLLGSCAEALSELEKLMNEVR
jgi:hypothetical protein